MKSVMCVTVAPMQQTKMTCAFNIAYTKEVAPYNYERVCMGETWFFYQPLNSGMVFGEGGIFGEAILAVGQGGYLILHSTGVFLQW